MMKKRILALALITGMSFFKVSAQELTIEHVSPANLSGVQMSPDEEASCVIYTENNAEGENDNLVVAYYNRQMMEMNKVQLEIPRTTVLLASCFSGETTVLFLGNADQKTRTIMTIDKQGNTMQKKEEENVSALLLKPATYIGLYAVSPIEFSLITTTSAKGNEFEAVQFNMNLDFANTYRFKGAKGKLTIEQIKALNDKMFLLCKETIGINNDRTEYYVRVVNLADTSNGYNTMFGEGSECGFPATMRVNEDMTVDIAGLFFNEGDIDKTPDGVMWAHIDNNGTIQKLMRRPWHELMENSKDKTIKDFSEGRLDMLVQDVFKMPGSQSDVLIGELFEKNNGGAGTANVAVKDFVLLKFSDEGNLLSVDKIEKAPKLATVRGTGATGGKYSVAKSLYGKQFFTYMTNVEAGEKINIVYRYNDGKTDNISVLSVSDSLIDRKGIAIVSLNGEEPAEVSKKNKQSKNSNDKNMPVVTMEIDLDTPQNIYLHDKFIPMKENQAMVQTYNNGLFTARIIGIPFK